VDGEFSAINSLSRSGDDFMALFEHGFGVDYDLLGE
jgi:hypothetical protein